MNKAYLLTGGNIGDRKTQLEIAAKKIENTCGKILFSSKVYETEAWGKTDQDSFYNQAILIDTALSPKDLLQAILNIEYNMGRMRTEKFGPRVIDIDILLYNESLIHDKDLTIPHGQLANRRFALVPLNEIAPNLLHPLLKKTIGQLLLECPDTLEVQKLEN